MTKLPLLLALLGLVSAPSKVVEPWPCEVVEGVVQDESEELLLFGAGQKRLVIRTDYAAYVQDVSLGFATKADYAEAERMIGCAVRVEGHSVRRGYDVWFVPKVLQERVR